MEKILISACLLGKKVRYNGNAVSISCDIVDQWLAEGRVVSTCPEFDAGMSIPRAPAEIIDGNGDTVWAGTSSVVANTGVDVTAFFMKGAQMALELCKKHNIRVAILTENSPSCGSSAIYDGSFTGTTKSGYGVTTALLRKNCIEVFSQHNIDSAHKALQRINR